MSDIPTYRRDDWINDARWVADRQAADNDTFNLPAIVGYFERKYGPNADWHCNRLFAALRYYTRHKDDFNEGSFGIAAEDGGVIGRWLLLALLVVYSGAGDDQMQTDWDVAGVKDIARKLEAARA